MLYYARSTGGFYDDAINHERPDDAVEITAERHAALMADQASGLIIQAGADGRPVAIDPPAVPAQVPTQVTMRQARLALLAAGKLSAVNTAIAGLPLSQKDAAQIEWEFSSTVERTSPLMGLLGPALELDEAGLDALFAAAAAL